MVWGEWSDCENQERYRTTIVTQEGVGAGKHCPIFLPEDIESNLFILICLLIL